MASSLPAHELDDMNNTDLEARLREAGGCGQPDAGGAAGDEGGAVRGAGHAEVRCRSQFGLTQGNPLNRGNLR